MSIRNTRLSAQALFLLAQRYSGDRRPSITKKRADRGATEPLSPADLIVSSVARSYLACLSAEASADCKERELEKSRQRRSEWWTLLMTAGK